MIVKVLVIIGGVNWGLVGLGMLLGVEGGYNIVNMLLSSIPVLEAVVYLLVGVAAVMAIFDCKCQKCSADGVCTPCGATEAPKTEGTM
ncbi:MAG: DUF378 domain-containing protein [Burkholderiales bacterium]|nr:DUF378 domain-containing protein [Burkholderiales bacterium]